jgi:two-component system, OmpR family, alkaline phosphatase synthesis response regulator PhoP
MSATIYIFSSNQDELEALKILFQNEGFLVVVNSEVNEVNINYIYKNHPDIILLDLNIDNSDGIELCYQLKSQNATNAIVALYSDHEEDYVQIEAYKAGADDYIIKPKNPRVLLKKINALLRRKPPNTTKITKAKILSHNKLKIDRDSYLITYNGEEISLPRKEFEILYLLINTPQKFFSREEICRKVWKNYTTTNPRIIDVHVRKIREKVGPSIINTIKGVGYQLA